MNHSYSVRMPMKNGQKKVFFTIFDPYIGNRFIKRKEKKNKLQIQNPDQFGVLSSGVRKKETYLSTIKTTWGQLQMLSKKNGTKS